jgi:hypothetical protein
MNLKYKYFIVILLLAITSSCKKKQVRVITNSPTSVMSTNAISGGEVLDDGGQNILAYGVCWGTSSGPVLGTDNFTVDGSGVNAFTSKITKLKHKTTYYVRAYVKYSGGITYGNEYAFYTPPMISSTVPIVFSYAVSNVDTTNHILKLNAEIIHKGGSDVIEKGFVWNNKGGPSVSDFKIISNSQSDIFSAEFNFDMSTQYYLKAYAINSFGVSYGDEIKVKIEKVKPKVVTQEIIEIDSNYAICTSNVTYSGGTDIIERGICWAAFSNPTVSDFKSSDGSGLGVFTSTMTGLLPNTLYYCRSYATNSEGTTYGKEISFRTMVGKLFIGMQYKGGIIFYIEPMKGGGLLVTNDDVSSGSSWGCASNITSATSKGVGSGQSNTDAILSQCGNVGAAGICANYKFGKYDDWYLPSYGELELIYKNLKETDKEKFSIGYYWSSTQKDASTALRYGFLGGNYGEADKASSQLVRAVRKF